MGIYMAGMEMPTSCAKCGWYSFIEEVCRATRCEVPAIDGVYMSRHKDCPLVHIPSHGDLVDRDVLAAEFWGGQAYFTDAIKRKINGTPVIIPSEEVTTP